MKSGARLMASLLAGVSGCSSIDLLDAPEVRPCDPRSAAPDRVRIATWNIAAAAASALDDIEAQLADIDADVVAVQEVDRGTNRSGDLDQDLELASALGYPHVVFLGADERDGGTHGDALLSRLPLARVERRALGSTPAARVRAVIDLDVCLGPTPARFITAHNDWTPWGSTANTRDLADLAAESVGDGVIVMGDLNQLPWWRGPQFMRDAGLVEVMPEEAHTYTGDIWRRTLDYVFADPVVVEQVLDFAVEESDASDHLPLWFELDAAELAARE